MNSLDLDRAVERFATSEDHSVGIEEEFSILDPRTLDLLPRFEEHGISIAAVFDTDKAKLGTTIGHGKVLDYRQLHDMIRDKNIVVGVLAVPTAAAQPLADQLVAAGVKIIFNYSESLLDFPPEVTVHTSSPAVDLLYALYFYLT